MLTRIRFQSTLRRNATLAGILVLAGWLIGGGQWVPRLLFAADKSAARTRVSDPDDDEAEADADTGDDAESDNDPRKPPARKPVVKPAVKQVAQFDEMEEEEEFDELEQTPQRVIGNGVGSMGRASYLGGKTFGRTDSITPLEFFPYLLTDEHFIFSDMRGFVTNNSQFGGNLGVGYRRLWDQWNAWGGASAWYDADQSTSKMFQQVGLSFEGLINQYEFRSNVYLPVTSTQSSNTISNAQIVGNQLLYSRSIVAGTALRGVDAEVGYSLPVLDRHIVRAFVGGYHFEGGGTGGVNGFRARVEGVINNTVTAQAMYTHDKLYGDNLMVGVSMQFPFGSDHPSTGWVRNTPSPFRFVERNYNVIVAQSQSNAANQVAIDPATGNPYVVEQVYAPATPGPGGGTPDGTTGNPFSTVAAAQSAGGNLIIVQSGSVLTQPITLASGQHLFGQGNSNEYVPTTAGGNVPIPTLLLAAGQSSATPVIQNVSGNAVTLASNTEVAGFNITGSTGDGIVGNGVSGVSLHDLAFSSIGGDAINLTNSSGSVVLGNIDVLSATGNGIVFNGGTANITTSGIGSSISAQGNGFVLENLTGGSAVVNHLTLQNIGGSGLVINDVAANLTINSLSVSQSGMTSGAAVEISGASSGSTYHFGGNTKITSPNGAGFSVTGTDAKINVSNLSVTSTASQPAVNLANTTGAIAFGTVAINTQNAMGLSASNVSNLQISGGSLATVNAPAMDIESSGINARLGSVSVNGGAYGIKLQSSTGSFTIAGGNSYASGGTIQNTTTAGVLINSFGTTSLNWVDLVNNAVGVQSTSSTQLTMSNLRISGSTGYAVDSLNDNTFSLGNSILQGNGASGGGTVRIAANTVAGFTSYVEGNTITDVNGTALQFVTQAGGTGATLATQVSGNTFYGYNNGSSVVGVNWNGPATTAISSNTFYVSGPNMTAISLTDPTLTSQLTSTFNGNIIYFVANAASGGTGIWITEGQSGQTSTGNANLTVTSNQIDFQSTGGTGFRFDLYAPNTELVTTNTVTDQAGGATGILYDYAGSGTSTQLTGNIINLLKGDVTTHRGIIFSQVASNVTLVTPYNTVSNSIFNTTTQEAFAIPTGTGAGGIVINGNYLVAPNW